MKHLHIGAAILIAVLVVIEQGCRKYSEGAQGAVESMRSGSLSVDSTAYVPDSLYIDWIDRSGLGLELPANHAARFGDMGYRIVDSPSKAGYILHVTILAAGPVARARLAELTNSGYGSPARFSGDGVTGLLADILLVQRRVPRASKPGQTRLKNIARRNAVSSSQMRLGLFQTGIHKRQAMSGNFRDVLLQEACAALPETRRSGGK